MNKYTRMNWENTPSTATPLTADNLNHMDEGIERATDGAIALETEIATARGGSNSLGARLDTVDTNLTKKANKSDIDLINSRLQSTETTLKNKANITDVSNALTSKADKADVTNQLSKSKEDLDKIASEHKFIELENYKEEKNKYWAHKNINEVFLNNLETTDNACYRISSCSYGEKYKVTYWSNSTIPPVVYLNKTGKVIGWEDSAINTGVHILEITIDNADCAQIAFQSRRYNELKTEKYTAIYNPVPTKVSQLNNDKNYVEEYERNNDIDRTDSIEQKLGFSFTGMQKGQIIFMFDDALPVTSDLLSIFNEYNLPMSMAVPVNALNFIANDGRKMKEVLLQIQEEGGEILSHSIDGNTLAGLTYSECEDRLRNSKNQLEKEGFEIHGWVSPSGVYNEIAESLYRKYYRYGYKASNNVKMKQYRMERTYLSKLLLKGAKDKVDYVKENKTVQIFFGHMNSSELQSFSLDDLRELIEYCKIKDVEVTTYRKCYYSFGGTEIEKIIDILPSVLDSSIIQSNLLNLTVPNITIDGITLRSSGNGMIITGTSTKRVEIEVSSTFYMPSGTYTLSVDIADLGAINLRLKDAKMNLTGTKTTQTLTYKDDVANSILIVIPNGTTVNADITPLFTADKFSAMKFKLING